MNESDPATNGKGTINHLWVAQIMQASIDAEKPDAKPEEIAAMMKILRQLLQHIERAKK